MLRFQPGDTTESSNRFFVTLGLHKRSSPSSYTITLGRSGPLKVIIHKNYAMDTNENDIAIINLDQKVSFNDHVRPICLPSRMGRQRSFDVAMVEGGVDAHIAGVYRLIKIDNYRAICR